MKENYGAEPNYNESHCDIYLKLGLYFNNNKVHVDLVTVTTNC